MHVVASRAAPGVVAVVNPDGASRLLDVGGGSGSYTLAFLDAHPAMRATLFDKPAVSLAGHSTTRHCHATARIPRCL